MRLAFMGSPAFSVPALRALAASGHELAAVYCQPPRPAGRGHAVAKCPVHLAAEAMGLVVHTPAQLRRDMSAQAGFAALGIDAAVVAAYGLILPQAMLDAPRRGCLNIHASLLPRWRGASPIQSAILAGDTETGVTIMRMEAGLDTGPMLLRGTLPIGPETTTPSLHDALSALGAALIVAALANDPAPVPQPEAGVTYAAKLTRADARIDWRRDASELDRQVRALLPWPGTTALFGEETVKIFAATPCTGQGAPGEVLGDDFRVACGVGALRLVRVQRPGRPAMDGASFLRGAGKWPGLRLA